jgi:(E)-4-hydroxy-3-methylbut-2-enyl-diphosphate synthase
MKTFTLSSLYCNSLTSYERWQTREVNVGGLIVGGNYPIRIQSMTTTDTMDTRATVEQSIRMIEAGCELVRITAPSLNEARNLEVIKNELHRRGYKTPIVADIHFTPNVAEAAARIVEKVRINPGNYADKKKFETIEYNDSSYLAELERIRERFTPLVKICKEYGTAMRIGTNHGSLSDRILSRYGDTPLGMVESAFEFLRICEDNDFHNIVLSMKASNTQVMVQAYRLLVSRMKEEGMNYPLHLGVTEAGEGEDGRIKSAVGIGTLLEDGLGDTVRVSLTEDPEFEIPVAKALVARYDKREVIQNKIPETEDQTLQTVFKSWSPFEHKRREASCVLNIGGNKVPVVIGDLSVEKNIQQDSFLPFGYRYSPSLDKWHISEQACDYIYTGSIVPGFEIPGTLGIIVDAKHWNNKQVRTYPLFSLDEFFHSDRKSLELNFIQANIKDFFCPEINYTRLDHTCVLVITTRNQQGMAEMRRMFFELINKDVEVPVILKWEYELKNSELLSLHAATDSGSLLVDGFGDGLWLHTPNCSNVDVNRIQFGILQASRTRISKTEYISCPSCGRTLFDLQETTAKIRQRTSHLKGVKIGIMGCIVNGPGEMADADYGYVGTGVGKITLYKGKEVVQRNIDSSKAVDALIELIKINGDWIETE